VKTALIILFHGSRAEGFELAVQRITAEVRRRGKYDQVAEAYLQHATPDLTESIGYCIKQGAQKIVIVPFFLQMGTHVTADIPLLVEKNKRAFPQIAIALTDAVGSHPLLVDAIFDLAEQR
jgi:sirohydrochlorin ferrochelatase